MANEEHVKILKSGVEAWNVWRVKNPDVRPDLTGADLTGADLAAADLAAADLADARLIRADLTRANLTRADLRAHLSNANLSGAYLSGADLTRAYLNGAKLNDARLIRADLTRANLKSADLTGADLTDANLSGAYLQSANLFDANLIDADLAHADLTHANFLRTTFADLDLRQVKGLETTTHHGPSPISTSTLERSHGQIPDAFLKGCGLSDWQIENARLFDPDLDANQRTVIYYEMDRVREKQAFHVFRVFISYTRQDEPFVEALEKLLDSKGVRYWRDVHDMKAGRMERQIDRAIDMNPLVLLVLSEQSVKSDWVEWEAKRARKLEQRFRDKGEQRDVLCPVALDDAWKNCDWPGALRDQVEKYNVLDFSGWQDAADLAEQFAKLYDGMVTNYRP